MTPSQRRYIVKRIEGQHSELRTKIQMHRSKLRKAALDYCVLHMPTVKIRKRWVEVLDGTRKLLHSTYGELTPEHFITLLFTPKEQAEFAKMDFDDRDIHMTVDKVIEGAVDTIMLQDTIDLDQIMHDLHQKLGILP